MNVYCVSEDQTPKRKILKTTGVGLVSAAGLTRGVTAQSEGEGRVVYRPETVRNGEDTVLLKQFKERVYEDDTRELLKKFLFAVDKQEQMVSLVDEAGPVGSLDRLGEDAHEDLANYGGSGEWLGDCPSFYDSHYRLTVSIETQETLNEIPLGAALGGAAGAVVGAYSGNPIVAGAGAFFGAIAGWLVDVILLDHIDMSGKALTVVTKDVNGFGPSVKIGASGTYNPNLGMGGRRSRRASRERTSNSATMSQTASCKWNRIQDTPHDPNL